MLCCLFSGERERRDDGCCVCVLCQRGVSTLHFPFTPSLPLLLSILTWSMVSASLLPPPGPSHGTRSPAACLVSSSSSSSASFPCSVFPIRCCCPHTGEAAWQPTAAPLHRGMLLSLLECDSLIHPPEHSSLVLSSCLLFFSSGCRANRAKRLPRRDSRSPFSFSSSFTRSLCKLASLPLCLHFPPLFPSPLPLLLQPNRARASK